MASGWINYGIIFIFGWTNPLMHSCWMKVVISFKKILLTTNFWTVAIRYTVFWQIKLQEGKKKLTGFESLDVQLNLFPFSLAVDRRVFGGVVVSQHPFLSVCGLHLAPYAGEPPHPLRLHAALPHQPLQNRLLQIPFLAHQTSGERQNLSADAVKPLHITHLKHYW